MARKRTSSPKLPKYDLPEFEKYARDTSFTMSNSCAHKQTASIVGKYLKFTAKKGCGKWGNYFDVNKLLEFYNLHTQDYKMSGSAVYNLLSAILKGADYALAYKGLSIPPGFERIVGRFMKVQHKRRRQETTVSLEKAHIQGVPDLTPFIELINRDDLIDRAYNIYHSCTQQNAVSDSDYLFFMRLCIGHVIVSMGLRPGPVYTFRMAHVKNEVLGDWENSSPILFRNIDHKTRMAHGSARIVVSGQGKELLAMYLTSVLPCFLLIKSDLVFDQEYVFYETTGNPLSSSSTNQHLKTFQKESTMAEYYTATKIRKCINSQLKFNTVSTNPHTAMLSTGLQHSASTNEMYYTIGQRDNLALEFHKAIVSFYKL